jgi:hypothetical protein
MSDLRSTRVTEWHQKEDRVRSHVLICFLAYAMWKTLAGWMKGAGLGDAPRTLLYEFAKIKSGDIVLPAESAGGIRTTVRLRYVTEPGAEQKTLLHRLGLTLPRRLSGSMYQRKCGEDFDHKFA